MARIGYSLSSEEFGPLELVDYAKRAEDMGFGFAFISDHFHPWTTRQGHSPFVWSVIGGIARATGKLALATGVTCPLIRMHPAIVAQAAATSACMMPGRFMLGLGTGENLNEHITGARWPVSTERLRMLKEAIDVIRMLLRGGNHDHHGRYYTVEDAQLFTVPDEPPPILVASVGTGSAKLAGECADGLVSTVPNREVVQAFDSAGGKNKPKYGQLTVCWARSEEQARRTALEIWPTAAVSGVTTELPSPWYFEQVSKEVDEKRIAENVICGPDPAKHTGAIKEFFEAGFDHVYVHQIGPEQEGFMQFYNREILRQFD